MEPCKPVSSKIVSLYAENNHLQFAVPEGLIGKIDPTTLCRADRLIDQVLGAIVTFQKSTELEIILFLLCRLLGICRRFTRLHLRVLRLERRSRFREASRSIEGL
ncbi:uncharacterized protein F5891DRAFT_1010693 [Suillus fuscotomentosus]|uniref:Uncharacterized protein n=1 Tax=Suillus fuscotomentosus TaxID=1912939 RepID=A0AAD4EHD9_9AGAM|nr:uncharacterized protein F5891DRAFT_1010693 [Suillus fuscotomentosus]KAG1905059.1 hypothetical protein F5891DRAFT_1010693 [Suillus fuscotomentosus]